MDGGRSVLVILDRQIVVVARLMIYPVIGRDHVIRIQGGDHVVYDGFGGEAQLAGVYAIDGQAHGGVVHILWNVDLAHAFELADAGGQILGDAENLGQVRTAHLDIDGSRHAHVENGI